MKADLFAQSGEKIGEIALNKEIFELPFNQDLVHLALVSQLANARQVVAHSKTRGMVRGSTKKMYAQKHTGNSRQGSNRAPHRKGGGVVFGPQSNRNFRKELPKKQRRKALFCALSEKARDGEILALDGYKGEAKTKTFVEMLSKLPIKRDTLIVLPAKDKTVELASKNIKNAKTILVNYINVRDLQKFDTVLFFKAAFEKMEELFLQKK